MDIDVFAANELHTVFRVLRTALRPNGLLEERERIFLDTYAKTYGLGLAGPDPLPVSPSEVHIEGAHQRKRLVQLSAVAALLSSPVNPDSVQFLKQLSRHLGAYDPVIQILGALAKRQFFKVKLLARDAHSRRLRRRPTRPKGLAACSASSRPCSLEPR